GVPDKRGADERFRPAEMVRPVSGRAVARGRPARDLAALPDHARRVRAIQGGGRAVGAGQRSGGAEGAEVSPGVAVVICVVFFVFVVAVVWWAPILERIFIRDRE